MHPRPALATTAMTAVLALMGAACGAGTPQQTVTTQPAAIQPIQEAPVAAEVIAAPAPRPVAETVVLREAELEIRPDLDLARDAIFTAMTVAGVDTVAPVRSVEATLVSLDADRTVTVAAVDGETFRPFTPDVTAQAPAVWERLEAGEALVRHDIAHQMGLELGGTILLLTETGSVELRIGAFASNGAPPIADVVVPWDVGEKLGQVEASVLLIDLLAEQRPSKVGKTILDALGGGALVERQAPEARKASLRASGAVRIDSFGYTSIGDGTIKIDQAWVSKYIVRVDLPRVGRTYVNKIMAPQLLAAMQELETRGLIDHLDPRQFAGGWVARHIDWNPAKPLSMHAWGLAVDFNSRDNGLGATPKMDPAVVEVFEKWGFAWGGRWSRPDGMHFELAQVVTPT